MRYRRWEIYTEFWQKTLIGQLGRPRRRQEENIKMDLKQKKDDRMGTGLISPSWTQQWPFGFNKRCGISLASQGGLYSVTSGFTVWYVGMQYLLRTPPSFQYQSERVYSMTSFYAVSSVQFNPFGTNPEYTRVYYLTSIKTAGPTLENTHFQLASFPPQPIPVKLCCMFGCLNFHACWKIRIYKTTILTVILYGRETWSLTLRENIDWGCLRTGCWKYLNRRRMKWQKVGEIA
jgi:hypothetical protein